MTDTVITTFIDITSVRTAAPQAPATRRRSLEMPTPLGEQTRPFTTRLDVQRMSLERFEVPAPQPRAIGRAEGYRFIVLQQWEGAIESVAGREVVATIRDLTDRSMADEQVVISIDEFSPDDQRLLGPGTVFYWVIGYRSLSGWTRERVSSIRLRRMPPPSATERARARKEAAVLQRLFDDNS